MSANYSCQQGFPVLVSFVVPIYNVEDYLSECLESLYSLERDDYEVVLVDDGSTDSSNSIASLYAEKYKDKTKLVKQENLGLSCARNTGLSHAAGDWVVFIDSDDFFHTENLGVVLDGLGITTADVIIYDVYQYVNDTGIRKNIYRIPNPLIGKGVVNSLAYMEALYEKRLYNFVISTDKIYRKEVLTRYDMSFIPGRLCEDVPFTHELFFNSIKVVFVDLKVLFYRLRSGSIMTTQSPKKLQHIEKNVDLLHEFFRKHNLTSAIYYDYLIMLAKQIVNGKQQLSWHTWLKLFKSPSSAKKKLVMFELMLKNINIMLKGSAKS